MRIFAIIEKGADGFYSIRSEQKVGRYFFGGYGDNVKVAKKDFYDSVKESLKSAAAEGMMLPESIEVSFK